MVKNKICTKCKLSKELSFFKKDSSKKDGYYSSCKECVKIVAKEYQKNNRTEINKKSIIWNKNNLEKRSEINKKYNQSEGGILKQKEYRRLNREKLSFSKREWSLNNIERSREIKRNYKIRRRERDPLFKIEESLRSSIKRYIKGKKQKSTFEILGIDIDDFKCYIESKFTEGMTWDNYGEWHLDHIIPQIYSKNLEELYNLNYYINFQPLWKLDNLSKSDKIPNNVEELYNNIIEVKRNNLISGLMHLCI